MERVAVCDTWAKRLDPVARELGVAACTDFDEFLCHDMDGVVLANYFHEHAPYAIRALRTGEQPYLDVYRAVDMSIAGILAGEGRRGKDYTDRRRTGFARISVPERARRHPAER